MQTQPRGTKRDDALLDVRLRVVQVKLSVAAAPGQRLGRAKRQGGHLDLALRKDLPPLTAVGVPEEDALGTC